MKNKSSRLLALAVLLLISGCKSPYIRPLPKSNVERQNYHDRSVYVYATDSIMDAGTVKFKKDALVDLYAAVSFAKRFPKLQIKVNVYEDDTRVSTLQHNLALFRAETIAAYFWSEGIAARRITYEGFPLGDYPVSSNKTPDGSQDNRRIEVEFSDAE